MSHALPTHALSIRQPWAGLIVAGVKTLEIRTWATRRRGWLAIHASKTIDTRPEAWRWVRPDLQAICEQRGGLIGVANLIDCIAYTTRAAFVADRPQHCNAADWYQPPVMYGFRFLDAAAVPLVPCAGNTGFFRVPTGSAS
jgi:hypothetical protein